MNNKVINISKKTFISVVIVLYALILVATAITYIVPNGMFGTITNPDGSTIPNFEQYIPLPDVSGISIVKGLLAPIFVLGSSDGLTIIMLSIFLLVISGSFQIINDTQGMHAIVRALISKFKDRKKVLLAVTMLIFMVFGSFLGLFEEVLTLLPLIIMVTISLGYDSFTAFLICVVGTGFGFASAITNPFTVVAASNILGISIQTHMWFRFLVFGIMYLLLILYVFAHVRKIEKKPESSPTYANDIKRKETLNLEETLPNEKRILTTYIIFFAVFLMSIILASSFEALRSYSVVVLIIVFLFGGFICGLICNNNFKVIGKSFIKGVVAALPAVLLVLLASSIKYILEEGQILATISNSISSIVQNKNTYTVAILVYLIILALEFFISSSTAKAIFVMGILSCVSVNLSKEFMVLIYLFGDGYTNVLFPTSPVLLIGLSMIGMNYLQWLKKSKWLFLINFTLVIGLICLALLIGY